MQLEKLKRLGLSLPHATVVKQWGENLVFKVGGKIFLIVSLDCELVEQAFFQSFPHGVQTPDRFGRHSSRALSRPRILGRNPGFRRAALDRTRTSNPHISHYGRRDDDLAGFSPGPFG
jgi:hypothetical protein